MRPLLFVIGLAFFATVLIPNIDAIMCYGNEPSSSKLEEGDCGRVAKLPESEGKIDPSKCLIWVDGEGTTRGCGLYRACNPSTIETASSKGIQIHCCSEDLCNRDVATASRQTTSKQTNSKQTSSGALASTPLVPLLFAVVAKAIAALVI